MVDKLVEDFKILGDGEQFEFIEKVSHILGDKMPCHLRGMCLLEIDYRTVYMCTSCNDVFIHEDEGKRWKGVYEDECVRCEQFACGDCIYSINDQHVCYSCVSDKEKCPDNKCSGVMGRDEYGDDEGSMLCSTCGYKDVLTPLTTKAAR